MRLHGRWSSKRGIGRCHNGPWCRLYQLSIRYIHTCFFFDVPYGGPNALLINLYKLSYFFTFLYIYHENGLFPLLPGARLRVKEREETT
jgi:hypothetical protein